MKDPMVVAFDVPGPWLRRAGFRRRPADAPRWTVEVVRRTNPENLGERVYRWWLPRGYRLVLGGHEYRAATLATVWHVDPSGYDTDERCAISFLRDARGRIVRDDNGDAKTAWAWRFHVHHWKVQVPPLQELRRRLLTRCAWCGGRSSKRTGAVDVSHQWDRKREPWWRGERGLFHGDCSPAETARSACTCEEPMLVERGSFGRCLFCGLYRAGHKEPWVVENERDWKTLAAGERPSPEMRARTTARAKAGRA